MTDIVDELREIQRMNTTLHGAQMAARAADEIMQLRQQVTKLHGERDEARREVCSMNETGLRMNESDKRREAKRRGWDCFKEKR